MAYKHCYLLWLVYCVDLFTRGSPVLLFTGSSDSKTDVASKLYHSLRQTHEGSNTSVRFAPLAYTRAMVHLVNALRSVTVHYCRSSVRLVLVPLC